MYLKDRVSGYKYKDSKCVICECEKNGIKYDSAGVAF